MGSHPEPSLRFVAPYPDGTASCHSQVVSDHAVFARDFLAGAYMASKDKAGEVAGATVHKSLQVGGGASPKRRGRAGPPSPLPRWNGRMSASPRDLRFPSRHLIGRLKRSLFDALLRAAGRLILDFTC